jgi:predicted dehydrogenase
MMPVRLAILGLDRIQHAWLEAVAALRAAGEIELTGVGHETAAGARDVAEFFKTGGAAPPAFDDVRFLLKEGASQVILMDRPANATLEFLLNCAQQEIGIFSLGPPVESVAEAQALAGFLGVGGPRTRLLYIWPRFADSPASVRCAQADEFLRPIRFASGTWLGINHALAKAMGSGRLGVHPAGEGGKGAPGVAGVGGSAPFAEPPKGGTTSDLPVRSLSVLAWDALSALIGLMGMPTAVYAVIRGTVGSGNSFADVSGAAAVTLRFADEAAASLTLCDRAPAGGEGKEEGSPLATGASAGTPMPPGGWDRRELLLWGAGGTLKQDTRAYEFRDADGELIDAGTEGGGAAEKGPVPLLREFLRQYAAPPSPHRGWDLRLEEVAATMEALVVSHRTGQAESPERFRRLRR